LLLYSVTRFLVEFLRSHSPEAQLWGGEELLLGGPLSAAQGISIALFCVAVWLLWLGPYRRQQSVPGLASPNRTVR
jgi:prolipoprotein diacylglyceryltransferase